MNESKNPFKVGDKVTVIPESMEDLSEYFKLYSIHPFAIVTWTDDYLVGTTIDKDGSHYTHYKPYKEEENTMSSQQKTKRVPFTHDLWEKWKDKGGKVFDYASRAVEQLAYFNVRNDRQIYAGVYQGIGSFSNFYSDHLFLEIPVITKRIPFDPELKDAKVFTTDSNQSVVDWAMFKDGQVACQWPNKYMGYYPTNYLEMEIEEDV